MTSWVWITVVTVLGCITLGTALGALLAWLMHRYIP